MRWRTALLVVAVVIGAWCVRGDLVEYADYAVRSPIDFGAFYCGGATLAHRDDPYIVEPLRACEHRAFASVGTVMARDLVVPAPLPPYALAVFGVLALLPFGLASGLWASSIVLASAALAWLTARLARARTPFIAVSMCGAVVIPSILLGQVAPLAILALTASALALRRGRDREAALCLAVAAIEPHVVAPACVALVLFARERRRPFLIAFAVLAMLSFASGGLALNIEYATRVLPLHAHEGLEFASQYSFAAILAALGAPSGVALALGALSYGVSSAVGIALAPRLARRFDDAALLVLVPATFSVMGGSFIHAHQLTIAIPLAAILAVRVRGGCQLAMALSIALLAIPWDWLAQSVVVQQHLPAYRVASDPHAALARSDAPGALAEVPWQRWVAAEGTRDHRTVEEMFESKAPAWLGLGIVAVAAIRAGRRNRRPSDTGERDRHERSLPIYVMDSSSAPAAGAGTPA